MIYLRLPKHERLERATDVPARVGPANEQIGALDRKPGAAILELFDHPATSDTTIVEATHHPKVAARCQRTVQLHHGKVIRDKRTGK